MELIILQQPRKIDPLELYTETGIRAMLQEIESEAGKFVADVTTPEGRKDIASMAYKVARTKTALDDAGKSITEDWKKKAAVIDGQRKVVRETLDALRDKIRKPLDEFEAAEETRIKERQDRIAEIELRKTVGAFEERTSAAIDMAIKEVRQLLQFDWQEFGYKAENIANEVIAILQQRFDAAKKYEEDQAELARLKKEKEERERKEREEKIAQEAADKAKHDAEEAAAKSLREAEELAERQRKKAEEEKNKAIGAKLAAEKRAKAAEQEAARAAEEAVAKERARVEKQQREEKEEADRREADQKHREKINFEAADALTLITRFRATMDCDALAKAIIEAIAKGEVPHVSISY